jgi:hypothetical protein
LKRIILILCLALLPMLTARAQNEELVASMETLGAGVQLRRAGTEAWVAVPTESLVGVGDSVRTDKTGKARITFFANGTDTEVLPASEFRIDEFKGTDDKFTLTVSVIAGQTTQRIAKLLDSGSSYTINSTGLELAVRGTVFAVRVEDSGRSAMIVQEGAVAAKNVGNATPEPNRPGNTNAQVPPGFGIRAEPNKPLSDVVKASSFAQLDSALDGCEALISTLGDVRLNVRLGPSTDFPRVGQLDNRVRQRVIGVTATTKWYRVAFKGGFAWLFAPALQLDKTCPGLREYPDNAGAEDATLYSGLDAEFLPIQTATPTPTP